jgi:lysophospholipase L1-like esterase
MWNLNILLGSIMAISAFSAEISRGDDAKKFFFGGGDAPAGYTKVLPTAQYSDQAGYGYERHPTITTVDNGGADALHGGFSTASAPFFFSIAEPEGNYKVSVTLGDAKGESTTTVKAELRRLMLEGVHTDAGSFVTKTFIVNVRIPEFGDGKKVGLKARETTSEMWAWDNKLTLEFNDKRPCLCAIEVEKVDVPTVYILGDSTVCDQPGEPFCSWGQMLPRFFKPEIAVANHAESGESVGGSNGARRMDKILSQMKAGDYFFVQFGHNDMKSKAANASESYKAGLKRWVEAVKAKGATPVIVTPMNRYSFSGDTITQSLKDYPDKAREAAKEENIALIDLNAMSKTLYETAGPAKAIMIFEHTSPTQFDHTHHSPYGAYQLAKCIVQGIRDNKLDLTKFIVDDLPAYDPAHPDTEESFKVPASPGGRQPAPTPLGS